MLFLERALLHGQKPKGNLFNAAEVARTGRYWTPKTSLYAEKPDWTVTAEGQYASVPVNAYRMTFTGHVGILHVGLVLSAVALEQFRERCQDPIETIHFILGNDVHPVSETELRCYVGFSFQTK